MCHGCTDIPFPFLFLHRIPSAGNVKPSARWGGARSAVHGGDRGADEAVFTTGTAPLCPACGISQWLALPVRPAMSTALDLRLVSVALALSSGQQV